MHIVGEEPKGKIKLLDVPDARRWAARNFQFEMRAEDIILAFTHKLNIMKLDDSSSPVQQHIKYRADL